MNLPKILFSLPLGIITICLIANNANAAYFSSLTGYTQDDLDRDIKNGGFVEEFSASSFIGDDGMAAYELELKDIIPPDIVKSSKTEQFLWENNQEVNFELYFDGTNLVYKVDDTTVQSTNVVDSDYDINGMLLSATSTDNSSVTISNLMLEDGWMSMENLLAKGDNIDFLKITGIDNSFKLTGTQTFTWKGQKPSDFELAYKIRVGSFNNPYVVSRRHQVEVPEPQTVSLLSIGAIALLIKNRRKKTI